MIDFNDVQGLMDFYRDFMSSHDVENIDFSGYRKIRFGDEAEAASDDRLKVFPPDQGR